MKKFPVSLIFVGRTSDTFIKEGCAVYEERIRRYADLRLSAVAEERVEAGRKDYLLKQEGKRVREKIRPGGFAVALDEKGRLLSSESFADSIVEWSRSGTREISFLLGGAYGLESGLKGEADFLLALSPMTLAHGLARMVLLEQIYRAFTLLRGEPYHK
jgi:23S rRNA (pseudouridine1915-N3)-methyltransferase